MLSIKKLLLPLLITSTFVAPACYAHQTNHTNISIQDQQLRERLHAFLKKHNIVESMMVDVQEQEKSFNYYAKFSIVPEYENIGNNAYTLMYPGEKLNYREKEISHVALEKWHPEYFSQKGTTYLLYHSYEVFIYARVMDDPSQPILFIKLRGNWDPNDHYVQWGETSADTFIGFNHKISFDKLK